MMAASEQAHAYVSFESRKHIQRDLLLCVSEQDIKEE